MNGVYCNQCGQPLVAEQEGMPRQSCEHCGATRRNFHRSIASSIAFSGRVAATTHRDDQPIGFTESYDPGLTRWASFNTDGTIHLQLRGLCPRNEQDSDIVCSMLVTAMATPNRVIQLHGPGDQDDDFALMINGTPIGVQVVRALTDPHFWVQLARAGEVSELNVPVAQAVSVLKTAIEHKLRIPPRQRPRLILLLDAYRLPALVLGPVTNAFKRQYASWVKSLGFYSVYVVGPETAFVAQLDELSPN